MHASSDLKLDPPPPASSSPIRRARNKDGQPSQAFRTAEHVHGPAPHCRECLIEPRAASVEVPANPLSV